MSKLATFNNHSAIRARMDELGFGRFVPESPEKVVATQPIDNVVITNDKGTEIITDCFAQALVAPAEVWQRYLDSFPMRKLLLALPLALGACQLSAGLGAVNSQAPSALAEIEQLKTAVVTAPLAGCVAIVQQANTLLTSLKTGAPAIPVASTPAPPILVVAAPAQPPVVMTSPSGLPTGPTGK